VINNSLRWKQNEDIENLIVSLINYQEQIAIIVLKEQGESSYLKESYQRNK